MRTFGRGLFLAAGTLTALRVPPVTTLTPADARAAMLLGPVAALPLGLAVGLTCWLGGLLDLPQLAMALIALAVLAMGSRALHLDGLSDVADGLTASYDRDRSLAVMKGGTAGPAGVAALVLVLGIQAAALSWLVPFDTFDSTVDDVRGPLIAATAVCISRAALWITCCTLVPPARPDGLGATFTQRIPVTIAVAGWVVLAALAAFIDPVRGPVTVAVAAVAASALVWRTVRRFGGVTGDVFGAAIEVALAVLLVGFAGA